MKNLHDGEGIIGIRGLREAKNRRMVNFGDGLG